MLDAYQACRLLEAGISLTEQGRCDERGEAPHLLLEWIVHVRNAIDEVRAYLRAKAAEEAQNKRR